MVDFLYTADILLRSQLRQFVLWLWLFAVAYTWISKIKILIKSVTFTHIGKIIGSSLII